MFAIEVELLTGRYAATAHHDRHCAEWPPHPARLFSALVAAYHHLDPPDAAEREALLWLERQPPPSLDVAPEAGRRGIHDVYVPVNDVTLAGDPEAPLRAARDAFAAAEAGGASPKDLRPLRKAVDKAAKKLADVMADLSRVAVDPSKADLKTAAALVPDGRIRQIRTFPVAIPPGPVFRLAWAGALPAEHLPAMERLCARTTYLGHSSSLVRCSVTNQPVTPTLVPRDEGELVLRTVGAGQLARLEQEYRRHQGVESRHLPARPVRYGPPVREETTPMENRNVFSDAADDWVVFERTGGARPLSSRGPDLARALRAALLEQHGTKTLPPELSGHSADERKAEVPHVAFLALPFVGHEHADASVQGLAIVLPRGLASEPRRTLLGLVAKWELERAVEAGAVMELKADRAPPMRVRRTEMPAKASLRVQRWCRPARRFVTATPIALDRNPGDLRSRRPEAAAKAATEAQKTIADACERIGVPRPSSVEVSFSPFLAGAQPAQAFGPWQAKPGTPARVRVHAEIEFDMPVAGPLLLGAGRFLGAGLCLPVGGRE